MVKRIWRGTMAIKSVILGALILIVWIRSHFVADTIVRGGPPQYVQMSSASGTVLIRFVHDGQPTQLHASWHRRANRDPGEVLRDAGLGDSVWNRLGFGFKSKRLTAPQIGLMVDIFIPHWLMFLLAIPSAVLWVYRRPFNQPDNSGEGWCPKCAMEVVREIGHCPRCGGPVGING